MKKWIWILLVLICSSAQGQDTLKVTYVGNMGVLLQHQQNAVLIDGLHDFYKSYYLPPTQEMVDGIMDGTFKEIGALDALLVTHQHEDHFDLSLSQKLLQQQSGTKLFAGRQITSQFSKTAQAETIPYTGELYKIQHAGITISGFKIAHSSDRFKDIQNVAWVVSLGSFNVLHVGDTEWSHAEKTLTRHELENIDLAILPFWMLTTSADYKKALKLTNAKKIAACHFTPGDDYIQHIKSTNPDVICLVDQGKTIPLINN